jgi:hypothetical protein
MNFTFPFDVVFRDCAERGGRDKKYGKTKCRVEKTMIAVTGAGGKTGLAIVKALADRGVAARGLVRKDTDQERLIAAGVGRVWWVLSSNAPHWKS